MEIGIKQRIRRWRQLRTIKSLTELLPNGQWWLHGGWALEAITGVPMPHKDIDIGVLESAAVDLKIPYRELVKRKYLDAGPIYEDPDPVIMIRKGNRFIPVKKKGDFIKVSTDLGSFLLPGEVLENQPRNLCGIKVYTVAPEFLFLLAFGSQNPRKRELRAIALLHNLVDFDKLQRIESVLHYRPPKPPFVAPPSSTQENPPWRVRRNPLKQPSMVRT